jgi:plastocyanin
VPWLLFPPDFYPQTCRNYDPSEPCSSHPTDPGSPTPSIGTTGPGGSAAPSGGPAGSGGPGGIALTASGIKFDQATLTAPADKPLKITLDNKDAGVNHDVDVLDAAGAKVFDMKDFTGPAVKTVDVPALKAGTYKFECSIHPAQMSGVLTVSG